LRFSIVVHVHAFPSVDIKISKDSHYRSCVKIASIDSFTLFSLEQFTSKSPDLLIESPVIIAVSALIFFFIFQFYVRRFSLDSIIILMLTSRLLCLLLRTILHIYALEEYNSIKTKSQILTEFSEAAKSIRISFFFTPKIINASDFFYLILLAGVSCQI
jgi:hypothetical protein